MSKRNKFFVIIISFILPLIACTFSDWSFEDPTVTPYAPIISTPTTFPPTPTITPTPPSGEKISKGDAAFFNGDWDRAIYEYNSAYDNIIDPEIKIAALLGLGKTYYQSTEFEKALSSLTLAESLSDNSPLQSSIFFALGQTYEALEQDQSAIDAYLKYYQLRPALLDHYIFNKIADIQFSNKDYHEAINHYSLAIQAPSIENNLLLNIKIGDSYEALGDIATSLISYQDVYNRTENAFIKSQMLYFIGYAQIELGFLPEGLTYYQLAVNNYPTANYTIYSLNGLIDNGISVDDFTQGNIYYYAGQYEAASIAYNRYLKSNPIHSGDAHYFYGLSLQFTHQYQQSILQFDAILQDHEDADHFADAADEISYIQWYYLDDYESAIETIDDFVTGNINNAKNPELLFFAGRIAERNNDLELAARIWTSIALQYSSSSYSFEGLYQAGIAQFRLAEYQRAIDLLFSALGNVSSPEEEAKAYFWIGKSYAAMNRFGNAQNAWIQAIESDPTGYYSERSSEILNGFPAFEPDLNTDLNLNIQAHRQDAEEWLILYFDLPQNTQMDDLSEIMTDLRFARGTEFWQLGLFNQARIEFESLRTAFEDDPLNSYRLANYFIDLGLYRPGIYAARQVLNLAGLDDAGTFEAPLYFNLLRFGLYYSDLIIPAAESYDLDPLLLFSIMRQESLFEGFVTSSVGARGLMQIMPATGDYLYYNTGWPLNYNDQDLYRPLVSVTYGANYLSTYRNQYNGSIEIALASYNAGPGNASAWIQYADGDPDLYLEIIRFSETRNYLRGIFEQYAIYKNLYQTSH